MKRILYFTLILAICSACTYRLDIEEPEEITLKFNASLPASFSEVENYDGTKADLKVGELAPKWHPGDFIKVFLPKDGGAEALKLKSRELTEEDIDPETGEATFTVDFKGVGTSAGKIGPFFAEYGLPDTTKLEIFPKEETKGTAQFIMNIPAKQTYSSEYVYNENECPMLAYAESNTTGAFNLSFQNVYGILKVSFTENSIIKNSQGTQIGIEGRTEGKEIKAVELVECGTGFISGKFLVTFGEGHYSDTDKNIGPLLEKKAKYGGDSKNKFIVRNTLEKTGNDYYFLLPAGSLANGFKLNILHKDGTYTTMTQGARTSGGLKRDVITKYTVTGTTIIIPEDAPLKTANCYVFPATNGVYSIPATNMGNGAQGNNEEGSQETDVDKGQDVKYKANSYALPSYSENYVAEVLWQTKNDDSAVTEGEIITLQGYTKNDDDDTKGEIRFNLTGIKGNAVIALKNKTSGTILWSWHIWVVDPEDIEKNNEGVYDFKNTITLSSNKIMMDRNLGAYTTTGNSVYTYGLMYQFGRKDPFPGAKRVGITGGDNASAYTYPEHAIVTSNMFNTYLQSIQAPNKYALSNAHVWIDPNMSGLKNGWPSDRKNLYDPCPIGWKFCGAENFLKQGYYTDSFSNDYITITNGETFNIPLTGWIEDAHWKDNEDAMTFTSISSATKFYMSGIYSKESEDIKYQTGTVLSYFIVLDHEYISKTDATNALGMPVRCMKWQEPEIPQPTTENTGNLSSYPSGN